MKRKNLEVFRDAVGCANSGKFSSWKEIEHELVRNGHRRAPHLLDSGKIRALLDAQCQLSRSQGVAPSVPS